MKNPVLQAVSDKLRQIAEDAYRVDWGFSGSAMDYCAFCQCRVRNCWSGCLRKVLTDLAEQIESQNSGEE